MAKAPAFQFYSGDFLTGTTLMSNAEVGLYIRLLCLQAEHGSIPDDVERIVRAYGEEARSLWATVQPKFNRGSTEGTLVNERLSIVLAARDAFRLRQSEKGKASAASRMSSHSTVVKPNINRGSTVVEPLGDRVSIKKGNERASEAPDGFDEFYASYPLHKGKQAAIRMWAKVKPADRPRCKPAIEAQVAALHFRGSNGTDFIPHPATWLNEGRWEDEVKEYVQPKVNGKPAPMTQNEAREHIAAIRVKMGIAPGGFVEAHHIPAEVREAMLRTQ